MLLAVRTVERLAVFLPASCSYLSVTRAEQIAGTISDCNKIILNIFARCCDGDYEANKPQRYELSPDLFLSVRRQLSVKAFSQRRPASEGKHRTSLCFRTNTAFHIRIYCYLCWEKGRMLEEWCENTRWTKQCEQCETVNGQECPFIFGLIVYIASLCQPFLNLS